MNTHRIWPRSLSILKVEEAEEAVESSVEEDMWKSQAVFRKQMRDDDRCIALRSDEYATL
jgi:hypothetical protein